MGLKERLHGHRVYVDANFVIYLVQGFEEFRLQIEAFRSALSERAFEPVTSEFTLCEVLVRPMQRQDSSEVEQYLGLLRRSGAFALHSVSATTFVEAARLRADLGLKTPDAIHVAAAVETGCTRFLSNDRRLRLPSELVQVRLS